MSRVNELVSELTQALLEAPEYLEYRKQLERVKQEPGLKEKIDDFRTKNFELQNSPDYAFDKMEQFEREYQSFRENPLVADFLAAELELCRMLQGISMSIVEAIEFE